MKTRGATHFLHLCPEMQANEIQCSLWISITVSFSYYFIFDWHFVMLVIKIMHLINLHFWTDLWTVGVSRVSWGKRNRTTSWNALYAAQFSYIFQYLEVRGSHIRLSWFSCRSSILIELEFEVLVFVEVEEIRTSQRKILRERQMYKVYVYVIGHSSSGLFRTNVNK